MLVYRCKRCGHVLIKIDMTTVKSIVSAREIIEANGGRCPNCERELELPKVEDIEVSLHE